MYLDNTDLFVSFCLSKVFNVPSGVSYSDWNDPFFLHSYRYNFRISNPVLKHHPAFCDSSRPINIYFCLVLPFQMNTALCIFEICLQFLMQQYLMVETLCKSNFSVRQREHVAWNRETILTLNTRGAQRAGCFWCIENAVYVGITVSSKSLAQCVW